MYDRMRMECVVVSFERRYSAKLFFKCWESRTHGSLGEIISMHRRWREWKAVYVLLVWQRNKQISRAHNSKFPGILAAHSVFCVAAEHFRNRQNHNPCNIHSDCVTLNIILCWCMGLSISFSATNFLSIFKRDFKYLWLRYAETHQNTNFASQHKHFTTRVKSNKFPNDSRTKHIFRTNGSYSNSSHNNNNNSNNKNKQKSR